MSSAVISTAQFKQLLSKYTKVEEGEASAFVDAVISTILEHLKKGESVEVSGFGTFQIVEAQQGQIKRVAFIPDDKIKEAVNAPFACFEPFVVSEGKKPVVAVTEPVEEPVVEPVEEEHEEEPETLVEEPEAPEAEPESEPAEDPEPAVEPAPVIAPTPKKNNHSKTWVAVLIAFIVIACLCLWWFLSSQQPKPAPVQPAPVSVEAAEDTLSVVAEEIAPEPAETVVEAKPVAEEPAAQRPTKEQLLLNEDGSPRMFALQPGERLTLIALNVYGDKAFWCYIYDVNAFMLNDPDNVPVGVQLYLPDPTYYNIEADDQLSLRRARNRGAKILNSKK